MNFRRLNQQVWEEIGADDPDWGVLTHKDTRGGGWSTRLDEFYATGRFVVAELLADPLIADLIIGHAIDWGCGTGRLSLALGERFESVAGIDIASTMVETARQRADARGAVNCSFYHLPEHERAGKSDFVLSLWVLQHVPDAAGVQESIKQIASHMKPGSFGVLEMPIELQTWRLRLQARYHVYRFLTGYGFPPSVLRRCKIHGMSMQAMSPSEFKRISSLAGLTVIGSKIYTYESVTYCRYFVRNIAPGLR